MIQKDAILIIKSMKPSLNRAELKIASEIIADPAAAANMPIDSFARKCGVSRASVVKFCKTIGFNGFKDIKVNLAYYLSHPEDVIMDDIQASDDTATLIGKVFGAHIKTLEETVSMIDAALFQSAVDAFVNAKYICFYGIGTSSSIAQDAYYRFMRIGFPAGVGTDPHISLISASNLDKDSVAIGISHTGRTRDIIKCLETAKNAGATVICVTSHNTSPITQIADIPLIAYSSESNTMKEAISARIAHIAILDSIYVCAALRKYDRSLAHINEMTSLLNQMRYDIKLSPDISRT